MDSGFIGTCDSAHSWVHVPHIYYYTSLITMIINSGELQDLASIIRSLCLLIFYPRNQGYDPSICLRPEATFRGVGSRST
jgi:hypothetical protein